jgi:hypothetical protein
MALEFRQEFLFEFIQELAPLLAKHSKEVDQTRLPLDPDWEQYAHLERQGLFVAFTARDMGLVGYGGFFVSNHPHHKGLKLVANDVFFLSPEYRAGLSGMKFIQFCTEALKAKMGEFALVWNAKPSSALHKILLRSGYIEEATMTKIMKEV